MNKIFLIGNLTRDPETNESGKGKDTTLYTRFGVAVNRRNKDDGADFFNCVAFGKMADCIAAYCVKGNKVGIEGRVQLDQWADKDGVMHYSTSVIVENVEFLTPVPAKSEDIPKSKYNRR